MLSARHLCSKNLLQWILKPDTYLSKIRKCWFESSVEDCGKQLLWPTTIFVQEGVSIHEVPLIVRKVNDIDAICKGKAVNKKLKQFWQFDGVPQKEGKLGNRSMQSVDKHKRGSRLAKHRIDIETDEGTAILFGSDLEYLKQTNLDEVLHDLHKDNNTKKSCSPLEAKIDQEINCRVAVQGLKRILDLENGRYNGRSKSNRAVHYVLNVVNRDAVIKELLKTIVKSEDSEIILETLQILKKDRVSPPKNIYRDWICDEALIRATDGQFTLAQLMDVVKAFSFYKDPKYQESLDALWVGIASREHNISTDNLIALFKILPYFHLSKDILRIIFERKLSEYWLRLNGTQMAEILNSFYGDCTTVDCLNSVSRWAAVNMITSDEKDLLNFIQSLDTAEYIDDRIERALEGYMSLKGSRIKDPELIATISNYCENLFIRNPLILTECGNYFIKKGTTIPPYFLAPLLRSFGLLYVQPPNGMEFWKVFNQVLTERFKHIKPTDVLDILLSCIYLERYPLEFVRKIFSPCFFERIEDYKDCSVIRRLKNKLKLFDASMCIECKEYRGPFIFESKRITALHVDVRIRRIVNSIHQPIANLAGNKNKFSKAVVLSQLPVLNFYILDILIHPLSTCSETFKLDLKKQKNTNTAIVINLPEHYCRNTKHLVGPQVMKSRQIRKLGMRLVNLDYDILKKYLNKSDKLMSYLTKRFESAQGAL